MGPELFDAVRALLAPAVPEAITIHDTDASGVAGDGSKYPFIVLSGGIPRQYGDAVGACRDEATTLVRVTHAALSPGAVRALMRSTRGALEGASPAVAGWYGFELTIEDSQGVEVDRDVKILNGGDAPYPFYGVDIYRVRATR